MIVAQFWGSPTIYTPRHTLAGLIVAAVTGGALCSRTETLTPEAARARGDELLRRDEQRMSLRHRVFRTTGTRCAGPGRVGPRASGALHARDRAATPTQSTAATKRRRFADGRILVRREKPDTGRTPTKGMGPEARCQGTLDEAWTSYRPNMRSSPNGRPVVQQSV